MLTIKEFEEKAIALEKKRMDRIYKINLGAVNKMKALLAELSPEDRAEVERRQMEALRKSVPTIIPASQGLPAACLKCGKRHPPNSPCQVVH